MSSNQVGWGLALGSAFVLAIACGSSSSKKTHYTGDAGAPGEAGSPSASGGSAGVGGPIASFAGEAPASEGGAAGSIAAEGGSAGSAGAEPSGEAGAPQCLIDGFVDNLQIENQVYRGCRGSRVQFGFDGDAPEDFTCCATSSVGFGLTLYGDTNSDGGGEFDLTVPFDAPLGTSKISALCDDSDDQSFTLEIVPGEQPVVLSVSAEVSPTSNMVIAGKHLSSVTYAGAIRFDGQRFQCVFEPDQQTDTKITCDFGGKISLTADKNMPYLIEVYSDPCGYAVDQPFFWVVPTPT